MTQRQLLLGAALIAWTSVVAVDREHTRSPKTPPAIPVDSLVSMYEVDGVKVIHRQSTSGEIVTLRVHLLGGSRQIDATNAGIEPVMLMASEYGTKNFPGNALRAAQARTGSAIVVGTEPDWTTIGSVGLAEDFDSTMTIIGDRLVNPTLDSAAIAIAKTRAIRVVRGKSEGPDGMVRQLAESLAFAGHPYQNDVDGTVASLSALTPASVAAYHKAQMVKSRMLVVVAGNVSRSQVEAAIRRTIGTLPAGTYTWSMPPRWTPRAASIAVKPQQIPTSYMFAMFGGPEASSADAPALQMGLGFLSQLINGPMRDSGLTYGAGAVLLNRGAAGGIISVTTGSPDRAMRIINDRIELLSKLQLPPGYLTANTAQYARGYQHQLETSTGQVNVLAESYLYHGDYRYFEDFARQIRQLTAEDMSRAVRAYVKNIQWAYLGDTLKMPRAMMTKY